MGKEGQVRPLWPSSCVLEELSTNPIREAPSGMASAGEAIFEAGQTATGDDTRLAEAEAEIMFDHLPKVVSCEKLCLNRLNHDLTPAGPALNHIHRET